MHFTFVPTNANVPHMNDASFKLRVPTSELEAWRARAGKRGLSAWIRERCNEVAEPVEIQSSAISEESSRELLERIAHGLARMDGVHPLVVMEKIKRLAALNPR